MIIYNDFRYLSYTLPTTSAVPLPSFLNLEALGFHKMHSWTFRATIDTYHCGVLIRMDSYLHEHFYKIVQRVVQDSLDLLDWGPITWFENKNVADRKYQPNVSHVLKSITRILSVEINKSNK